MTNDKHYNFPSTYCNQNFPGMYNTGPNTQSHPRFSPTQDDIHWALLLETEMSVDEVKMEVFFFPNRADAVECNSVVAHATSRGSGSAPKTRFWSKEPTMTHFYSRCTYPESFSLKGFSLKSGNSAWNGDYIKKGPLVNGKPAYQHLDDVNQWLCFSVCTGTVGEELEVEEVSYLRMCTLNLTLILGHVRYV